MAEHAESGAVPVNDMTPEEVSRIIHSHRKVRYGKCDYRRLAAILQHTLQHWRGASDEISMLTMDFTTQAPRAGRVVSAK